MCSGNSGNSGNIGNIGNIGSGTASRVEFTMVCTRDIVVNASMVQTKCRRVQQESSTVVSIMVHGRRGNSAGKALYVQLYIAHPSPFLFNFDVLDTSADGRASQRMEFMDLSRRFCHDMEDGVSMLIALKEALTACSRCEVLWPLLQHITDPTSDWMCPYAERVAHAPELHQRILEHLRSLPTGDADANIDAGVNSLCSKFSGMDV